MRSLVMQTRSRRLLHHYYYYYINVEMWTGVLTNKAFKYLCVKVHCKLTYEQQISRGSDKAPQTTIQLNRLMPNVGHPHYE